MLMEKKDIFDEHQTALHKSMILAPILDDVRFCKTMKFRRNTYSLSYGGEEAVEDTCGLE